LIRPLGVVFSGWSGRSGAGRVAPGVRWAGGGQGSCWGLCGSGGLVEGWFGRGRVGAIVRWRLRKVNSACTAVSWASRNGA